MTRAKVRLFAGSFLITSILIGAVCGFIAVDLSTDRYMPGQFSPIFLISGVGAQGAELSWMGGRYRLEAEKVWQAWEWMWNYRGLLPRCVRMAGGIAAQCLSA